MTEIHVSSSVLQWALQRSGRASKIQYKFPKITEWLEGKSYPTMRQLEALANATLTPLGYFFLPEPPEERLPIPYFRTLGGEGTLRPSPELLETVHMMKRRQAWMREYLVEQGHEPLPFVGSAKSTDDPREVAREIRATLGLREGWASGQRTWTAALRMLQNSAEDIGIILVVNGVVGNNTHHRLDVAEFRGFVLVDEYAPLIFINGADGKAAQMFTLAHELAHVWLGNSAAFDLRELQPAADRNEQACNQVAAEFLVPADDLYRIWPLVRADPDRFQQVARLFKVSELAAARRALDLGLIPRDEFREFYQTYQERQNVSIVRPNEGGDFYAMQNLRVGRRFAEAVVRAVKEGRLLYREAYQLTGLYGKAFARYAQLVSSGEMPQL
ncbi:MAG TPA: ImmA/IrrE family metallo-endopeptidase [Firmicutes bacterium]|nr:ImmA/IrrE family metallo-endopeptidase [Candidatus Fermentithermobacillaceae bacterium]